MKQALPLALLFALAAPAVQAQVLPYNASALDQHRWQAEQQRQRIENQRLQSEQRRIEAQQMQQQTRLNRLEIEARRQPEPLQPGPYRTLRSPEEERALRLSATERARRQSSDTSQIDAWLDRRPN